MTPTTQALIHTVVFLALIVAYVITQDHDLLAVALGYGGASGTSVGLQAAGAATARKP